MPVEPSALRALVEAIARFYVSDRKLRREQERMQQALALAAVPSQRDVGRYLRVVKRYFTGFEREARAHLADLDRRLAKVDQLQFNLTAERGVTSRRVEVTHDVLARLAELVPR